METKIFSIWTKLVEAFIEKIPHEQSELNKWFDTKGAQMFEVGQREYFLAHKSEYFNEKEDQETKFKLAYEQIVFGFNKVFAELKKAFPSLDGDNLNKDYASLKNECVSEKFLPFIAARAAITTQYAKMDSTKIIENIKFVIASYQLLQQVVQASINFMHDYLAAPPSEKDNDIFKNKFTDKKYAAFIAANAVIEKQYTKMDPHHLRENIAAVIASYQFLYQAAQDSIASMQDYLAKIPPIVPRSAVSPVMYKQPSRVAREDTTLIESPSLRIIRSP